MLFHDVMKEFREVELILPLSLFLTPSTASNSNRSTPACSPVLRPKRSPTPQSLEPGENMVEKGHSDHSSDKSPSTPEQVVQRTYSLHSARSGGKNSKVSFTAQVGRLCLRALFFPPPTLQYKIIVLFPPIALQHSTGS